MTFSSRTDTGGLHPLGLLFKGGESALRRDLSQSAKASRWIGRAIVLVIIWPTYLVFGSGVLNISVPRLVLLGAIALFWLLKLVGGPIQISGVSNRGAAKALVVMFIIWSFWRILCDMMGDAPVPSLVLTLLEIITIDGTVVLPLYIAGSPEGRRVIAYYLFYGITIAIVVAIVELVFKINIGSILGSLTSTNADLVMAISTDNIRDGASRVKSIFSHPIILAQNVGALAPLMLALALNARNIIVKVWAAGLLATVPVVISAAQGRSGYIVLAASLGTYIGVSVGLKPGQLARRFIPLAMVLAIGGIGWSFSYETFSGLIMGRSNAEIQSGLAREEMLTIGTAAADASPIHGYGHGMSVAHAGLVGRGGVLTIDNYYLSALLDFGYVGAAILSGLAFSIVIAGVASVSLAVTAFDRSILIAFLSITVSILVGLYVISSWDSTMLIAISAGVFIAIRKQGKGARRQPGGTARASSEHGDSIKRGGFPYLKRSADRHRAARAAGRGS